MQRTTGRADPVDLAIDKDVAPEWFRPWVVVEQGGTSLWTYELSVVPGLLQTEAHARAQLDGDEAKVAARLDRQQILTREQPPRRPR